MSIDRYRVESRYLTTALILKDKDVERRFTIPSSRGASI